MRIDTKRQLIDYNEADKLEVGHRGDSMVPIGKILEGSKTHDFGNLADGAGDSTNITVTGAALGDYAIVSFGVDTQDMTVTANVTAADTVKVRVQNESGGAVNLASTTLRALVIKRG